MMRETEKILDKTLPATRLKDLVRNKIDLWRIAYRLNVNPSTIQKILDGRPVSRIIVKKIAAAYQGGGLFDDSAARHGGRESNRLTVERLKTVHSLYKQEKSLRTVGEKLGLSRERVRQMLEKGSEIGLFKYASLKSSPLSGENFLNDSEIS